MARSKNEQAGRCGHILTEKHMQVLLQVLVYDCTISGDIRARLPQLIKVEEYAYRPQLLMSVFVKMKVFELTRTINEVFPVVEFESEGGGKYATPTMLNHIEVPNAARQVQVWGKVDNAIESIVDCAKPCRNK